MEVAGGENIWLAQEVVQTLHIEENFRKCWSIRVTLTCTAHTIGAGWLTACHQSRIRNFCVTCTTHNHMKHKQSYITRLRSHRLIFRPSSDHFPRFQVSRPFFPFPLGFPPFFQEHLTQHFFSCASQAELSPFFQKTATICLISPQSPPFSLNSPIWQTAFPTNSGSRKLALLLIGLDWRCWSLPTRRLQSQMEKIPDLVHARHQWDMGTCMHARTHAYH